MRVSSPNAFLCDHDLGVEHPDCIRLLSIDGGSSSSRRLDRRRDDRCVDLYGRCYRASHLGNLVHCPKMAAFQLGLANVIIANFLPT
jgi:hypothetical protein